MTHGDVVEAQQVDHPTLVSQANTAGSAHADRDIVSRKQVTQELSSQAALGSNLEFNLYASDVLPLFVLPQLMPAGELDAVKKHGHSCQGRNCPEWVVMQTA